MFCDPQRVAILLGGPNVLKLTPEGALDVHDLLASGLPAQALLTLVKRLVFLQPAMLLEKAIGISMRTVRRKTSRQKLSQEQSARLWKFAEVLAKASEVFGSQKNAEEWLERPAIGLDQRRPIDLLLTPPGIQLLQSYLQRLACGVYT